MTKPCLNKYFISLFVIISFLTTKAHCSVINAKAYELVCGSDKKNPRTITSIPPCTTLTLPLAGTSYVSTETDLTWKPIFEATGYNLTIGTSSGGNDILNNIDVGDTAIYNLPVNLPENSTIYVSITPYNNDGVALMCAEESFTTQDSTLVPECTYLLTPLADAINVPVNTELIWNPVTNATGYNITLETFTNGIDVLNRIDVGNTTHYVIPTDLPGNTLIYVIITPYNLDGEAKDCIEETFTTGTAGVYIPPKFFTPNNDNTNDYWIVPNPINSVVDVFIYDRYGKLLKQIINLPNGWDGTISGIAMPANDYWYQIIYKNNKVLRGHFSLIR